MIRLTELKIPVQQVNDQTELSMISALLKDKYNIRDVDIIEMSLYKKAIDARKKGTSVLCLFCRFDCQRRTKVSQ